MFLWRATNKAPEHQSIAGLILSTVCPNYWFLLNSIDVPKENCQTIGFLVEQCISTNISTNVFFFGASSTSLQYMFVWSSFLICVRDYIFRNPVWKSYNLNTFRNNETHVEICQYRCGINPTPRMNFILCSRVWGRGPPPAPTPSKTPTIFEHNVESMRTGWFRIFFALLCPVFRILSGRHFVQL